MEEEKDHSELILLCVMHKFFFVPIQISEAARIGSKHSIPTEVNLFLGDQLATTCHVAEGHEALSMSRLRHHSKSLNLQ